MRDIYLTSHFKLSEFTESPTAQTYGIDNSPSPEIVKNLRCLCEGTLEPLREKLGLPVIITSGYRCKALNERIIHNSRKSQHMKGQASDFYVGWNGPENKRPSRRELLIKAFRQIITDENIDYDQCIIYPSFIHVSHVSHVNREQNRRKLIRGFGNGKYQALTREQALSLTSIF